MLKDYVICDRFANNYKVLHFGMPIATTIIHVISEEGIPKIEVTLGENHHRELLSLPGLLFTLENAVTLL